MVILQGGTRAHGGEQPGSAGAGGLDGERGGGRGARLDAGPPEQGGPRHAATVLTRQCLTAAHSAAQLATTAATAICAAAAVIISGRMCFRKRFAHHM